MTSSTARTVLVWVLLNVLAIAYAADVELRAGVNSNTTWGLQRISFNGSMVGADMGSLQYQYNASDVRLGAGVDMYIVDSGVRTDHVFFQGKARSGWTFNGDETDEMGHGTHVCATAAGHFVGVASNANKISVKILQNTGNGGSAEDVLAGLDWIANEHARRKSEPDFVASVINISITLYGLESDAFDAAVRRLLDAGIHIVASAGNDAKRGGACGIVPVRLAGSNGSVISVGSINADGKISSFSNTGACVDIYGPGESIYSASHQSANATEWRVGTSHATPHVSGLVAYLAVLNPSLAQNPAAMKRYILKNALRNIGPKGTLVAYNADSSVSPSGLTLASNQARHRLRHRSKAQSRKLEARASGKTLAMGFRGAMNSRNTTFNIFGGLGVGPAAATAFMQLNVVNQPGDLTLDRARLTFGGS